ncbi:cell division protein ZapA [Falsigemmobacter intermedius]|uniref:Cell division protein ZapA n=1 Tax=Falsigemmobacter intermedius TaxID=1553448 RepID=A0A444MBI6_9RHOB|nr:cell division protein ZapA [Falsigemmobacter intermedius]RWY41096.1 cell division protein ZapA [Falsigemmobacter intermedius]
MPELDLSIGGRVFRMSCQPGEEGHLRTAAAILDAEAAPLMSQAGRMPEARMLLMAGLMLADRLAGHEDQTAQARRRIEELEARLAELEARPPEKVDVVVEKIVEVPVETRVEVPVIPRSLIDRMAELAAEAESMADAAEERAGELADLQFDT